jgi:hypothetical protein
MAHQQTMAMFVSHNQRVDRFSFCQMALIEIDGLPVYLLKMGGSFYGYVK